MIPVPAVLIYAFMTIRLEDVTVMDFLRYAVKFFISTQQYFEWRQSEATRPAWPMPKLPFMKSKYGGDQPA
jgi:hypothetical protein